MVSRNITENYISSLRTGRSEIIEEIHRKAVAEDVPVMERDSLEVMLQFLRLKKPDKILEIGAAVGYSAVCMLSALPDAHVFSVERDEDRAREALNNAGIAGMKDRFHLIKGDALETGDTLSAYGPFDALFIDAAKGQYRKFFDIYEPMVNPGGIIVCDNVLFKGMVSGEKIPETRGVRSMVGKIQAFNESIMKDPGYNSVLLPAGDGILISIKKETLD